MKNILLFQVGENPYAIDLSCVRSIQSLKHIVAKGAEGSSALIRSLDDEQASLYDLISVFEKETVGRDFENEKIIVVEAEGISIRLIVSRVDNVISLDTDRIEPLSPIFPPNLFNICRTSATARFRLSVTHSIIIATPFGAYPS